MAFDRIKKQIKQILKNDRPLRYTLSILLRRTGLCRIFSVQRPGYRLRFHDSQLSQRIWANPDFDLGLIALMQSLPQPGEIVFDIGANIGDSAIAAAKSVGSSGRVYACEPNPRIMGYLRANLALNSVDNVRTAQMAAGGEFDWVWISDYRGDAVNRVSLAQSGHPVPLVPVSHLVTEDHISVVKIDVEGFEKAVLDGLDPVLDRVSVLVIEVSDKSYASFGAQFVEVYDLLANRGFRLFRKKGPDLAEVPRESTFPVVSNVIACRSRAFLEQRLATPNSPHPPARG